MLFTIFGATGDLTTKKLMPALYNLFIDEQLPETFVILSIGRRAYTRETFIKKIEDALIGEYEEWSAFKTHIHYYQMDFSTADAFHSFSKFIEECYLSKVNGKIFYLATAPYYFPIIAEGLINEKIVKRGDVRSKIIFEKPFGENLASAKAYNRLLLQAIDESQIYRIDHYLGKEMLQNILTVRFANRFFEKIWSREDVESVVITAYEEEGVKNRGGYYDKSGALKDMVQNHLFQTLALVGMDPPEGLNDCLVKDEKVKVLKALDVSDTIMFGQYDGYLEETGIPDDSKTETFVALKLFVNTKRWHQTPFYLITGKKMKEKHMRIVLNLKDSPYFFEKGTPKKNSLTIEVYPKEGIEMQFNGKAPGIRAYTMPMKLDYCHLCNVIGNTPEAYEKLISDVIHDDASLFTRWDEIEAAWEVIDRIGVMKDSEPLYRYKSQDDMLNALKILWPEVAIDESVD